MCTVGATRNSTKMYVTFGLFYTFRDERPDYTEIVRFSQNCADAKTEKNKKILFNVSVKGSAAGSSITRSESVYCKYSQT